MKTPHLVLCLLILVGKNNGIIMDRCSLITLLTNKAMDGFAGTRIADWICLVNHSSHFNTSALQVGRWTTNHGIFLISARWWCSDPKTPITRNNCNLHCDKLQDSNLTDDIHCAKAIVQGRRGLAAWRAWRNHCKGKDLSQYTAACEPEKSTPGPLVPVPSTTAIHRPNTTHSAKDVPNTTFPANGFIKSTVSSEETAKPTIPAKGFPESTIPAKTSQEPTIPLKEPPKSTIPAKPFQEPTIPAKVLPESTNSPKEAPKPSFSSKASFSFSAQEPTIPLKGSPEPAIPAKVLPESTNSPKEAPKPSFSSKPSFSFSAQEPTIPLKGSPEPAIPAKAVPGSTISPKEPPKPTLLAKAPPTPTI